CLQGDTSPFTF
nr:immunoglobulin light chain junction region [Macaca mulatta]MOV82912.1 immunoglobulin light chain junction region [Macaca mulatta]MOV84682.1 immunoglobulin light chain junction region [Macaca mulatta]MOV84798.1 immunoglobulin light chain junction region [Macaca mulatta]MOV85172.1 immunoglobulin light chain junction region [Macaca mulatta]